MKDFGLTNQTCLSTLAAILIIPAGAGSNFGLLTGSGSKSDSAPHTYLILLPPRVWSSSLLIPLEKRRPPQETAEFDLDQNLEQEASNKKPKTAIRI